MDKKVDKGGQVAVWVILALVLVSSIVLFFVVDRRVSSPTEIVVREENPEQFISQCVRKNVNEVVDIMLPKGGFIEPKHSKLYKNVNITYLCYNKGNYHSCINQHPVLLTELKNEIENYITPKIDECFKDLKVELEKRKSEIILGNMELRVDLAPERVYVNINRKLTVSKGGESSGFENFDSEVINPVYNLGRIAMEIASQEAEYCYFEHVGYMILYPEYKISKYPMSDSSVIYSILDKKSNKEMKIAIRGCAIPAGI